MKLKFDREFIKQAIKKNILNNKCDSYDGKVFTNNEIPEHVPKQVIDYVKTNFTNKLIMCCSESFTLNVLFDIEFLRGVTPWNKYFGGDIFYEIFKRNKVSNKVLSKHTVVMKYGHKLNKKDYENHDWSKEPNGPKDDYWEDKVTYKIRKYYIHLHSGDMGGSYDDYIFQVDENGDLVLPEFNYIELKFEDDELKDSEKLRNYISNKTSK